MGSVPSRHALLAEHTAVKEALLYKQATRSLLTFYKAAWPLLEPGRKCQTPWHIRAIADALEAVADGRIRRLVINIPYRSGKSTLISVAFPAWLWASRSPGLRLLTGSHSMGLAVRDALRMRRLIESPWFQHGWGDTVTLAGDQNVKTKFETTATGHRIPFGVTAGVTGEGADCIIIDDANSADDMFSEAGRQEVMDAWDQKISTRLNDPERSTVICVQQRVHIDDASGHLLKKGGWAHLRIPCEFEPEDVCELPEIGFRDPRKLPAELYWPDRFPREWVEEQKRNLGSFGIASQLQQRPAPLEGGMVNLAWFRRYRVLPSQDQWTEVLQAWDTAQKGKELVNAPWVGMTWVRTKTGAYLVRVVRRWMGYPEGKRTVVSEHAWCCANLTPPHAVLIEDKSTGSSLLQELGEQTSMPLLSMEPDADKLTRLGVESPAIEAGNVWLPEAADWLTDFETEIAGFPNSSTADQADCLSMSLKHFREGGADAGPRIRSF